jgi:hypothetical protein
MLIIWRGLGFLVPLIGIGALLATQSVIGNGYYQSHGWPKFVAGLVGGLLVLLAGYGLNKDRPSETPTHSFLSPSRPGGSLFLCTES